jgi:hypothetical protein
MHLGGVGLERNRATDKLDRVTAAQLPGDDAGEMEACGVAGNCRTELAAQAFGVGETTGAKMLDRRDELSGNSRRIPASGRRLRAPQTPLP